MEESMFWNGDSDNPDPLGEDVDDNDDNGSSGNTVDFLSEVRSPCLICGDDVEIDIVVKQEVGEFEERCSENGEEERGSPVRGVVEGENGAENGNVDHRVFHWFLKWFGVDLQKKGKPRGVNRGWDGLGGDILRFCGGCKMELIALLELQKQLDELKERIENGLGDVKGKMEGCEGAFQSNGIYERDDRYKRVRSRIVKYVSENSFHGPSRGRPRKDLLTKQAEKVVETEKKKNRRKSSRTSIPVSRFDPSIISTSNEAGEFPEEDEFPELMVPPTPNQHLTADEDKDLLDIKPASITDSVSRSPSPPPSRPAKKVRDAVKKKAGTRRKVPKLKKKVEKKPKSTPTPKKSRRSSRSRKASSSADLEDEDDDNYYLDSPSSSDEQDKPGSRPQRKKQKVKDEDFILEDDAEEQDDDDDLDLNWSSHNEPRRKYSYKLDPITNLITLGPHTFTLSTSAADLEKISCTSCKATLRHDKNAMWFHITKYHTNRFPCPSHECSFKGFSMTSVRRHFKAIHEGVPQPNPRTPCRICGKPIQNTKRCKLNHEWTHLSQEEKDQLIKKDDPELLPDQLKRRWQCDECGKGFHAPSDLKRHKERHHSEEGFQAVKELCAECGETFVDLEGHRRRVHGVGVKDVEERFWECTEEGCGKRFKQVGLLTKHKNAVHRGIRPWGCNLCTRRFVKEEALKKHLKGHLGVREWKCGEEGCGAAFVRKAHLQRHQRIYHEEGSRPRRKVFLRGPTVLGVGFKKEELQRKGTYYPPSALKSWAKGRVPGHLMGKEADGE